MPSCAIVKVFVIAALLILGVCPCQRGLVMAAQTSDKPKAEAPAGKTPPKPVKPSDKLKQQSFESSSRAAMQAIMAGNTAQDNGSPSLSSGHVAASIDGYTGTMTTAIPIAVPAGRHGMQPVLQLIYRSGAPSGWLGIGWQLDVGTIERNTKFG